MKEIFVAGRGGEARVSLLVSLYNYERYIEQALDSVANQTLRDIELIVCDDCSTDNGVQTTTNWLEKHADRFSRTLLVSNDINSGLAATRNQSIACANAPFIFILDADNFIFPRCLERSSLILEESPEDVAFVYAQRLVFNEEDHLNCCLENLPDWNEPLLTLGNYIDAMVLHRKEALCEVGGYAAEPPFDRQGWEDFELWFRYMDFGLRGVKLHQPLIAYRVHGASMIRTTTRKNSTRLWQAMREKYPHFFA